MRSLTDQLFEDDLCCADRDVTGVAGNFVIPLGCRYRSLNEMERVTVIMLVPRSRWAGKGA
jgi:hypothetical protein